MLSSDLYSMFFFSFLFFLSYNMLYMHSPVSLAVTFMVSICISTYYFYLFLSDFMSYMLFLIYIGGLLVLLIYMIMVSMNYIIYNYPVNLSFIFFLLISTLGMLLNMFSYQDLYFKPLVSSGTLILISSSLVLLGIMLLYIFLNVCSTVILGGRTLDFGA